MKKTINSSLIRIKTIEFYQWAMAMALLAAIIHFIFVLFVVLSRINYRYELEWMEGASLVQAYRIFNGQPLYLRPSLEYIPLIYPPLYFYVAAVLAKIIGFSFLPLRIISFASTLGCFIVIFCAVRDKTNSILIGIVASGAFAASFRLGGAWFDIARIDMLFTFLCLASLYFLGKQTTQNSLIAGVLLSLAFLTKQTALPIFVVLTLSTLILFRKQTIPFVGSFTILTLLTYFILNTLTNGWYKYYILTLPGGSQVIGWLSTFNVLWVDFGVEAVILIICLFPLFLSIHKIIDDKLHLYYYFASIGFIATSILARINHGAYDNTLLPAYTCLAILFGMGIGWLILNFEYKHINKNLFQSVLWVAIIIQFIALSYNPFKQIPTQADRRAGDTLVSEIQSVPGDVLIPYHNYLGLFAGKKVYFHFVAFDDVRSFRPKNQPELRDILKQLHSTPFSLFIMDIPDNLIQISHCAVTKNIQYETAGTFYPVTGFSVRPSILSTGCP
jgi:hypothetical protein